MENTPKPQRKSLVYAGTGLDDLLSEGPSSSTESSDIACNLIDEHPSQPRKTIDAEFMVELTASIKSQGVKIPIVLRPGLEGRYFLVAG